MLGNGLSKSRSVNLQAAASGLPRRSTEGAEADVEPDAHRASRLCGIMYTLTVSKCNNCFEAGRHALQIEERSRTAR